MSDSCDPWTEEPDEGVHGILQVRVLEWGAISFSISEKYIPFNGYIRKEKDLKSKNDLPTLRKLKEKQLNP